MKLKTTTIFIGILLSTISTFSQVKVYKGVESIPTYKRAKDVTSPVFYTGRGVQGAAGKMYPYPAQTNYGDERGDMDYNMVYLENEYIKVTILPDFGGKIYKAVDKTTGYEIIHSNTSIKYDLIGTLGAWVSGGIEWCFPHHHRPSTLLPADYVLQENKDGSATVWIGETERISRLRGIVGVTLHPGCSYFEVEYRLNNPTDITKTFLFWANASMTGNKDYRTFWPPQQEIAANHNNSEFIQWPIADGEYKGTDYADVDLTWWKNHPDPKSFFFWDATEGFIGGYDYGENSGTIHVGNVHENKTSKLFQFGPGTKGEAYRKKLTDDGKAYVELMTGTFSNNQPDYSWFAPHSVKDAKNYWYGIRDIEIAKNANINAAVTLQMRDNKTVFYGFNTTRKFNDAKVVLTYKGEEIVSKIIDIDPATPFTETYRNKEELDEYQLFVQLLDKEGKELVSYAPYKLQKPELPEVQEKVKPASEIESVEDLYLAGRFVEQFSRPFHNPDDYYLAALDKSPNDYRVNLALGIRRVNQWRYTEALEYLQKAADKLKVKYWQPKEGEIYYYMALAQKGLGMTDEAYRNFYQSTWYYEWFSAGFYQLALMESAKGDYVKAHDFIKEAWTTNNRDGRIAVLYSALSRKLGLEKEALRIIDKQLEFDPINYAAQFEKELLGKGSLESLKDNMSDIENNFLDIAINYSNAGLYNDGVRLLTSIKNPKNSLVYYYLAWFYENSGQQAKAKEMLSIANSMSVDYIFPYRKESEQILKYAVKTDAQNSVASYLLGNLLYDYRKDDAINAWENAAKIDAGFSMIWRNLAFAAFHHQKDVNKAIDYLSKALDGDKNQPIWYAELAKYYDASDKDYKECLLLLEENIEVVKVDAGAPKEVVKLLNLDGQYNKSVELLKTHHFRTWEGGRVIHSYYVNTYTLKALGYLETGNYKSALKDLEAALLYPENLEVGKPNDDGRNALINFIMGEVYSKMGKKKSAQKYYTLSANTDNSSSDLKYYQGMSYLRLGEAENANKLFNKLIAEGDKLTKRGASVTGIGVDEASSLNKTLSNAYYLQALGEKGLGKGNEAKKLFEKSLSIYKNNIWTRYYLSQTN
jgi:tetratricopeptide (TPR) repeat protein